MQRELIWKQCYLVETTTGEVLTKDITPKFSGWAYDDFEACFRAYYDVGEVPPIRFLEPMFALEPDELEEEDFQIAELKLDGHRCTMFIGTDTNRVFSRRISKKTGWFNENSDQVPHIRDLQLPELYGTVLDGEIKWGKDSSEAQGVMGALPETAIFNQSQNNNWAILHCFDILYYKGINVQKMPLIKRKEYLHKVIAHIHKKYSISFITELPMYARKREFDSLKDMSLGKLIRTNSFADLFKELVNKGEEGIIVKDLYSKYEQGKYSKSFLKLKAQSTWDCVFMGVTESEKEYTGKKLEENKMNEWMYWEYDGDLMIFDSPKQVEEWLSVANPKLTMPVTKPYAMGWCGGIRFGVWKPLKDIKEYKSKVTIIVKEGKVTAGKDGYFYTKIKGELCILVEVGVAKGLNEEIMQDLKINSDAYIKGSRPVAIMANTMINKETGSLRHPRFHCWRDDINHDTCTWDKYMRK